MKHTTYSEALSGRELEDRVAAYLTGQGFRVIRDLRIRTWKPDIVATRGDDVIVVEAKSARADARKAMAQAAVYATDATSAYLALPPSQFTERVRNAADALGIGLLEVDDSVRQIVAPDKHAPRPSLLARARRASRGRRPAVPPEYPRRRPTLDRVLRHRAILDLLLKHPGREFTIREVAGEAKTAYATTWRTVRDLVALGLLSTKRAGHANVVSLRGDPSSLSDLQRLRSIELSPHHRAAKRFADRLAEIPDVRRAVLFGSVARGTEDVTSDVDVAVVVDKPTDSLASRVRRLAEQVQDETGLAVIPILMRPTDLDSKQQLARDIRKGEVLYERH